MSAPETGESTASLNRRFDEEAWLKLLPKFANGAILKRDPRTRCSYIDGEGGLSDTFVRRKVREKRLQPCGLDQFRLVAQ